MEFLFFSAIWISAAMQLTFSLGGVVTTGMVGGGILTFLLVLAFERLSKYEDKIVRELVKPTIFLLVAAIAMSSLSTFTPIMLCILGPTAFTLWGVERRYAYEPYSRD